MPPSVRPAALPLRTEAFPTLPREATRSIYTGYTGTAPDPRIDSHFLDYEAACKGFFGTVWHYVVRTNGDIEIGRSPRTRSTRSKNHFATTEAIQVGLVGGFDPETGDRVRTTTAEQEAALEWLYQKLADTLQVPLEIHDGRDNWAASGARHDRREELEADEEAAMDRAEAVLSRA